MDQGKDITKKDIYFSRCGLTNFINFITLFLVRTPIKVISEISNRLELAVDLFLIFGEEWK